MGTAQALAGRALELRRGIESTLLIVTEHGVDLSFSEADRRFQQEVREWLATAWPEEVRARQTRSALGRLTKEDQVRWQKALHGKGWAAPHWPREHGGADLLHFDVMDMATRCC